MATGIMKLVWKMQKNVKQKVNFLKNIAKAIK